MDSQPEDLLISGYLILYDWVMAKKSRKTLKHQEDTIKTSLKLPRRLWRKAHIQALDEGSSLQRVIEEALEAYFKKGGKS